MEGQVEGRALTLEERLAEKDRIIAERDAEIAVLKRRLAQYEAAQPRTKHPKYGIYSRELRNKVRESKLAMRDEVRRVQEALATARADGETEEEIFALEERLRELKEQKKADIDAARSRRRAVKEELHILRARRKAQKSDQRSSDNKSDVSWSSERSSLDAIPLVKAFAADPWSHRLPNMHKLFPAHSADLRAAVLGEVAAVLASPAPLPGLVELFDRHIARASIQPTVADFGVMDALVHGLGSGDHFLRFLDLLQGNTEFMGRAVGQSYHHDLFEKMVVLSGVESPWKLRVHVFTPEAFTVAQEEVHSHRNHFVSRIMHGGFTHQIWETAPAHDESAVVLHKYTYDPLIAEDGTRVFNVEAQGTIALRIVDEASVHPGMLYYMHPHVLHAVSALQGRTVTLVLNAPQTHETSCFATYEPWAEETFERQRFTEAEMLAQFDAIRALSAARADAASAADVPALRASHRD